MSTLLAFLVGVETTVILSAGLWFHFRVKSVAALATQLIEKQKLLATPVPDDRLLALEKQMAALMLQRGIRQ